MANHRKGNTATRSPYYLIAITHRAPARVHHPCNRTASPHNTRVTFSSLLRHGSIRILLDIVLLLMSYLFPTSGLYFDILLVAPTPTLETPAFDLTHPCSIGVPVVPYPRAHSRVGMCYRHEMYRYNPLRMHTASVYHHCPRCVHVHHHGQSR
jgi:hypothetical protein